MNTAPTIDAATGVVETPTTSGQLDPHSTRGHHRFGMSKQEYLATCAWFTGREGTSAAAEEGTRLHELCERVLDHVDKGSKLDDAIAREIQGLEDKEAELIMFAFSQLRPLLVGNYVIFVEKKLHARDANGETLNFGTADIIVFYKDTKRAAIVDWKFGWVPVTPAKDNYQGRGYAWGVFDTFNASAVMVRFVQPKLRAVTDAVWYAKDAPSLYIGLKSVIFRAELAQSKPFDDAAAGQYKQAGLHCEYCSFNGKCDAQRNLLATYAKKQLNLPEVVQFNPENLKSPEDAAKVRHWIALLEPQFEEAKKAITQLAVANNGIIGYEGADGPVSFKIIGKRFDRVLGAPIPIMEALKGYLTPAQILGAAKLSFTALTEVFVEYMLQEAKKHTSPEEKLPTKTELEATLASVLEGEGLLSRPDGMVNSLRIQKTPTKQLKNSSNNTKETTE